MQPQQTVQDYVGIVSSEDLLACVGKDGQLKNLFWPYKDAFHSHLEFAICGLSVNEEPLWLDPSRDQMRYYLDVEHDSIEVTWNIAHPLLEDALMIKTVRPFEGHVVESFYFFVPEIHSTKQVQLWSLSTWTMNAQKRFQCVYSETGEDLIYAYAQDTWVGIAAFDPEGTSFFHAVRAIHGLSAPNIGEMVNTFLTEPHRYRRLEMGNSLAATITQPIHFKKYEGRYLGSFSLVYQFGHNQEEVEKGIDKFMAKLMNAASHKEENGNSHQFRTSSFKDLEPVEQEKELKEISLKVLKYLSHPNGAILASAECDPDFKNSGGYGFVWPRDAAFCALSLLESGKDEQCEKILTYLAKVQTKDGDFFQRYDAKGAMAPGWCELQADQLGLFVYVCFLYLEKHESTILLESAKKGIIKLYTDLNRRGSLQLSFDLWEEFYGFNFYAHVCSYAGLKKALVVFPEFKDRIEAAMQSSFQFCTKDLHVLRQRRFARGVDLRNNRDLHVDISLLACIYPFTDFPLSDIEKKSVFDLCRNKLTSKFGILRYEGDRYMGGNPWVLSGFWLGMAAYELSKKYKEYAPIAKELYAQTVVLCNAAGFFPEQIGLADGKPIWITPLAWSHAFHLIAQKYIS